MGQLTFADRAIEVFQLIETGDARNRRIEAGLSLEMGARSIGVSTSALFRWESGQRRPRGRNLLAYHKFLSRLAARASA